MDFDAREPNAPAGAAPFYGWVVAVVSMCVTTTAFGTLYSFGVFFPLWSEEWSVPRALLSGIFSVTFLMYGLGSLVMGFFADHFGLRRTLVAGGLIMGLGCLLTSRVTHLWELYLTWGVMVGVGVGTSYSPTVAAVSRWFGGKKGLPVGMVVSGLGLGTLIFPLLCERLVDWLGWRHAAQMFGIIVWTVYFGAALLAREASSSTELELARAPSGGEHGRSSLQASSGEYGLREALLRPTLWILFAVHGLWLIGMSMPMVHLVSYCLDLGIPFATSAAMLATMGGMSVLGRVSLASVTYRLGARRALMCFLWAQTGTMLFSVWGGSSGVLWLFAILFGFSYGGLASVFPIATSEYFGLQALGAIFGLILLGATVGGTLGPILAGYVFDRTHQYSFAFLVGAVSMGAGAALLVLLPKPTHRA